MLKWRNAEDSKDGSSKAWTEILESLTISSYISLSRTECEREEEQSMRAASTTLGGR